jgi:Ca-activated chloride channel family protein
VGLTLAPPARADDALLEADRLYREQKYPQAAEKLVELSLEHPEDPTILERLGSARYRAGDYAGAARAFESAAELRGDGGADDLYNSGNASYQAGRLEDAQARYDEALAVDPDHAAAKQNRELVAREIASRRAQKPPPPPQPGEGEQEQPPPQPGEDEQQAQDGEQGDQQGQPKEGEGEPKDGEPSSENQKGSESKDGKGAKSESGPEQGSEGVDPGTLDGEPQQDGEPGQQGTPTGEEGPEGPITSGQAHRLLDSVEEGSQRVVVQGRPEDKPW